MPRIARFVRRDVPTVYHIISRTALQGLPIQDRDNDYLLSLINRLSKLYFVDVLGFAFMGNHFHLVVRMYPESDVTDQEIKRRLDKYYGDNLKVGEMQVADYRQRLADLGAYVKDIKQGFTRYFNKKYNRRGFFWDGRFKSMIVQDGKSLVNLLAYVDLNPVRAGIVKRPEDYRWCSLGYHVQTKNRDDLLSVDFGMKEWNEFDPAEIVREYRRFVYETGAVDTGKGRVMDAKVLEKERRRDYKLSRADMFRHRSRYFIDAGVIGGKSFVRDTFDRFKHLLGSKDERRFTRLSGVSGIYSMKRLGS
ncbi:MAG: transposase [Thermodesulfobacteriota bacterium]